MNRFITLLLSLISIFSIEAQNMKLVIENDSTFNAAYDYAKTSDGFDVDITKVNIINLGVQVAQDLAYANSNNSESTSALTNDSYYRQRMDLFVSSALPERTNVYSTISFINNNSDGASANVYVSNMEIEHFFGSHYKFRVGRLSNSVSESQFFGRMALEESSAHVFGRKLFINDAIEFDGNLMSKGGPVFFIGMKPKFSSLNIKGFYAGFHQPFKSGFQLHGIFSLNRQFEDDLRKYIPDYTGKQTYFSYEGEIAYKRPSSTVFLNVGGNLGFKGLIPHASGSFDYIKQILPVVLDEGDSFKETFTSSAGFRLFPSKINPSLKHLSQAGLEAEVQGALTDRFTSINLCAYCRLNITRRMILTYYCTPQFIFQNFNKTAPDYIGGVINYLRLSVTVGKPSRMFL